MGLISGTFTTRLWETVEALPADFAEQFERNLQRQAFKPIDPERGQTQSAGWVNIRQLLDARLTLNKVLFRDVIALSLRIDRLNINQKIFRATLAQEIGKKLRERGRGRLSPDERTVLEDSVRQELIKRTQPSTVIYDVGWNLERGLVAFGSTGEKANLLFSDLFAKTFQISIRPLLPYMRAQAWAQRQGLEQELTDLLPAPFTPEAPAEVLDSGQMPEG